MIIFLKKINHPSKVLEEQGRLILLLQVLKIPWLIRNMILFPFLFFLFPYVYFLELMVASQLSD